MSEDSPAEDSPAREQKIPTRAEVVGRIAHDLQDETFGTGPLAELRRLDPSGPLSAPALHRLLARHVSEAWVKHPDGLRDWALLIHCLALAAPDRLFGTDRLGKTLHDAGFGETRLANLLDADPVEQRDRLPRAVRFLVHRGGALNGPQLADLIMNRPDTAGYDRIRQWIASDYYRAEHAAARPATSDTTPTETGTTS